jgi:hypothetical protein
VALRDQIFVGGVWVDSAVRFSNDTGTMITSAQESASGEALADDYTVAASAVASGTATITVTTNSPNNPYGLAGHNVYTGVALDGATIYRNIIPGVNLVFSNTTVNGNASTVHIGVYAGTFDAFGVGAGVPSAALRHQVLNSGTGAVASAVAKLLAQAVQLKTSGNVFTQVKPFALGATENVAGGGTQTLPYHLSISATTGSGGAKTATLQLAGVTFGAASILDISAGTNVDGTALEAIASHPYRIITGPLTGVEFNLDPACAGGDTANILIFPSRYVQIAPEVSGSPGAWGTTDVVLTQSGQSAGVIQPAGVAYYYTRIVVPAGSGAESNPHPANVALSGTETGAAAWRG